MNNPTQATFQYSTQLGTNSQSDPYKETVVFLSKEPDFITCAQDQKQQIQRIEVETDENKLSIFCQNSQTCREQNNASDMELDYLFGGIIEQNNNQFPNNQCQNFNNDQPYSDFCNLANTQISNENQREFCSENFQTNPLFFDENSVNHNSRNHIHTEQINFSDNQPFEYLFEKNGQEQKYEPLNNNQYYNTNIQQQLSGDSRSTNIQTQNNNERDFSNQNYETDSSLFNPSFSGSSIQDYLISSQLDQNINNYQQLNNYSRQAIAEISNSNQIHLNNENYKTSALPFYSQSIEEQSKDYQNINFLSYNQTISKPQISNSFINNQIQSNQSLSNQNLTDQITSTITANKIQQLTFNLYQDQENLLNYDSFQMYDSQNYQLNNNEDSYQNLPKTNSFQEFNELLENIPENEYELIKKNMLQIVDTLLIKKASLSKSKAQYEILKYLPGMKLMIQNPGIFDSLKQANIAAIKIYKNNNF
ncbi:hypothetical protein ABPG74_006075 [Tetrahymena malaccensis]